MSPWAKFGTSVVLYVMTILFEPRGLYGLWLRIVEVVGRITGASEKHPATGTG